MKNSIASFNTPGLRGTLKSIFWVANALLGSLLVAGANWLAIKRPDIDYWIYSICAFVVVMLFVGLMEIISSSGKPE